VREDFFANRRPAARFPVSARVRTQELNPLLRGTLLPPSGVLMRALFSVILLALELYTYVIVVMAIMSWLIAFNVINVYNDFVRSIWNALNALTEPLLRPIRRVLPNLGGIDISPVILILIIYFVRQLIISVMIAYPYAI
jgi:YggT family protein